MFPILLEPSVYAFKNRWRSKEGGRRQVGRDLIVFSLAAAMAWSMYIGTEWSLLKIKSLIDIAYLPASHPIGLILGALFLMLLISNIVIAMSVLLFGRDLDFIISAPLTKFSFFSGKFLMIATSSSWMSAVFIVPFLLAFGVVYHAGLSYYLMAIMVMVPFFCIPAALAMIFVILFSVLVPVRRTKEILWLCLLLVVLGVFAAINLIGSSSLSRGDQVAQLMATLELLAMPQYYWLPSNWIARPLQEMLEPTGTVVIFELVLLYSVAIACIAASYLVVANCYQLAYSHAYSYGQRGNIRRFGIRFDILNWMAAPVRAVVAKEFKTAAREMSQVLQLLVLVGIGLIYLYNLRILSTADAIGGMIGGLRWRSFIFILNSSIGAFITTALCTRLVFPSVSLEGRAVWILEQSPITERQFLLAKFFCWIVPVMAISWVVNVIATYLLAPNAEIMAISSYSSVCTAVGIVGLAVGLGAVFHNFDWEHSSQLQASFGSLIFMLLCVVLIAVNQIPTGFMVLITQTQAPRIFAVDSNLMFILNFLFLGLINPYIAFVALRAGHRRLVSMG